MLLVFSRNVGLKTWEKVGNLSRELELYNKLVQKKIFKKIFFFTYNKNDVKFSEELKEKKILSKNIFILSPPLNLKIRLLRDIFNIFYFLFIFMKISKEVEIIKTNQIDGSYLGVILKIIYKKKLYLRSGYNIIKRDKVLNFNFFKKKLNILQFKFSLRYADSISVSNLFDKRYYSLIFKKKTELIYNFINTSLFYDFKKKRNNDFLYIGRISKEKNIIKIIEVFKDNPKFNLHLYGDKKINIKSYDLYKNIENIKFFRAVPNNSIPKLLNEYRFLILPSNFEGLSKTVLEGMGCGIFCIVSDLIENKFLIKKNLNGYLLNKNENINLNNILETEKNNIEYKDYNKKFINDYFSFEKYIDREVKVLKEIL